MTWYYVGIPAICLRDISIISVLLDVKEAKQNSIMRNDVTSVNDAVHLHLLSWECRESAYSSYGPGGMIILVS